MAIRQTDISVHNNPNLAVVDSDFVKGGFRTAVATVNDLYALSGKTDEPSAAGQVKEYATIVYVSGETKYYILTDVSNIDNAAGWEEFQTGGGAGTVTGATNGLTLSGADIILGGDLTGNTTINLNDYELQISTSGVTPSLIGIDPIGIIISTSGSSVTMDTNEGFIYGNSYTSSNSNWIPTKLYVDSVAIGLNVHPATWVATTGNIVLSGLTTVDGVLLNNGDRVLVKSQTDDTENGIYDATGGTWQRSADYNFSPLGEIANGDLIPVTSGTTLSNSLWAVTSPNPIVSGDSIQFTLFSRPIQYIGGHGINVALNTISVDGASLIGNSLKWSGTSGNETFNVDITTGTLSTALNSKLNVTTFSGYTGTTKITIDGKLDTSVFSGYTGTTQPIINTALTGATSYGSGSAVYSGETNRNLSFRSIVGSGDTVILTSGNSIIVYSSSGGSGYYSGQSPSAIEVGGIPSGTNISGCSFNQLWEDLLVPELYQTSVGTPSTSVGLTLSSTREIGCSFTQTVTPTYVPGTITPLYDTTSPFTRGGAANAYSYKGPSMVEGFTGSTSCVINPYVVTSGLQTWCVCTRYDEGACIKGSKGTVNPTYPTVCPLNSVTAVGSASITGILPYFYGNSVSQPTANQALINTTTGATGSKTVATSTGTINITYGVQTGKYLWFATPCASTTKLGWYEGATNKGNIGTPSDLFDAPTAVSVDSPNSCWSGECYKIYISTINTDTSANPYCMTNTAQQ